MLVCAHVLMHVPMCTRVCTHVHLWAETGKKGLVLKVSVRMHGGAPVPLFLGPTPFALDDKRELLTQK